MSSDSGWIAVRVAPGANRAGVVAALFAAGSQALQEVGDDLLTQLPSTVDTDALIRSIRSGSEDALVAISEAPDVNWLEYFKQGIRAQELGALVVAPPWLADRYDPARTIVIEPGMAFGTGEHATTRGVVRLLQQVLRPGDRVADLGAGSAVLSIASAKLGAGRVAAIEIDPDAIGNAEENVERNGVADRVTVIEGDASLLLPLVAPVDLVLANILAPVLIDLLPTIREALRPDRPAILSGILQDESQEITEALASAGWRVEAEDREDVWWSAVIVRQ